MAKSNKMTLMAQEFRALKDEKDAIGEREKEINKRLKVLTETELPEYMDQQEIEKVSIDGVGTIFTQMKIYANVLAADRDGLYEHLRETGNEALIVEYVHPPTLKAFCKEQLENGKPVPPMVTAHFVNTAQLRRK